ncbi:MAG: TIGR02679 family protein [Gammaproteobacteria bacterium]|nr:TIGR02679 family protein [Gammaproteobacteria bacterium]
MNWDRERLTRLLGGAELKILRERLRSRFERGTLREQFTLSRLNSAERRVLEGLLGRRSRRADSMRMTLTEVDEALRRAGVAESLRDALEALDGHIPDLNAERGARERSWEAVFAAIAEPRLIQCLEHTAAQGMVKRLAVADSDLAQRLLTHASRVLARLPATGVPRSRLAAEVLGDAHALDKGRPVATLVVAALRAEQEASDAEAGARDIWARAGVLVNELARPALALNLRAHGDMPLGMLAEAARTQGEPLNFSLRGLLRAPPRWRVSGCTIYVCENPSVVAIAADRLGATCAPLVCTDGMPAAAQRTLLAQLAAAGARLCYHGDFDWPGIHIGNFVMRAFATAPWCYGTEEYLRARRKHGHALAGDPVTAAWDVELTAAMMEVGFAVHEEAVVEQLLEDLDEARVP